MRWHYTTLSKLPLIIQSGQLIALEGAQQRATVWFSSNDAWEPTASKGISFETDSGPIHRTATIDEELAGGPVRIGVEDSTAPYDWEDYKKFSGAPPKLWRGLYQAGLASGAQPSEWFASFEPVPSSQWLTIQVMERDSKEWRELSADELNKFRKPH